MFYSFGMISVYICDMKIYFKVLLFFLIFTSCKEFQKVSDTITKPSAKDVFERELKQKDTIFKRYQLAYYKSRRNTLKLELPTSLSSKSNTEDFSMLSYTVSLERGEKLKIESEINADSLQLVIDVFTFQNDSIVSDKPVASNKPTSNLLEFEVKKTSNYKVVIFPELKKNIDFSLKIFTKPTFLFPVAGKENKAIQSFWGAQRDGGRRKHKGIDIFAKRGTPVIAVTNGYVSSAKNSGLGGKQVWQRSGIFGYSMYYAHLDSIAVSARTRLKAGDTLGFVGNTGNARTTSPHLHFGMYTSSGAINPLPFVKKSTDLKIANEQLFKTGFTKLNKNELRIGASTKFKKVETLERNRKVTILSKVENWYHLKVNDSLEGFMHKSLIMEAK